MNRIADITDLDISTYSSDSDDDVIFPGHRVGVRTADVENCSSSSSKNSNNNNNNNNKYGPSSSPSSAVDTSTPIIRKTAVIISLVGIIIGASAAIGYTVINSATTVSLLSAASGSGGGSESSRQQRLLEIAERVTTACDENKLNEDMSECQNLCNGRLCCFEKDEYGCQADAGKDCPVYAGCEALVEGVPVGAEDEDEA